MAIGQKRLTFTIPPNMELLLMEAKRHFYDCTRSEMIRTLIWAGLESLSDKEREAQPREASADDHEGFSVS